VASLTPFRSVGAYATGYALLAKNRRRFGAALGFDGSDYPS
jgi:hypothetical protein